MPKKKPGARRDPSVADMVLKSLGRHKSEEIADDAVTDALLDVSDVARQLALWPVTGEGMSRLRAASAKLERLWDTARKAKRKAEEAP